MLGAETFLAVQSELGLLSARAQMAFTLAFHILFACFGVGMPVLMVYVEHRYLKTGDPLWRTLAKRWSKAFAVLFAVGAVSGTVLSFELGLLWPEFMAVFGPALALPLTLEGIAFFLEAIFVGIYLYAWDRLSPRAHWWSGVPIAVAGAASAFFIMTGNAFMQTPQGVILSGGALASIDPLKAMFNPSAIPMALHMILGAYMVTGFGVASIYAWHWLRGERSRYIECALKTGLVLGALATPVQILVGDGLARLCADVNPIKFAAFESHFETRQPASFVAFGWPDQKAEEVRYALEIPLLLSLLAHHDPTAEVRGLKEFPRDEWPPVAIVHFSFQIMVGIGTGLLLLSIWFGWQIFRRKPFLQNRLFMRLVLFSGPATIVALWAGWVTTEVGRQPWIVRGLMRVSDAVTDAPGMGVSLMVVLGIYLALTSGLIAVLRILARKPLPEDSDAA